MPLLEAAPPFVSGGVSLFRFLNFRLLGLRCSVRFSLVGASRGYSSVSVCRRLIAVAPLVVAHGAWACRLQWLQHVGSVVAAPRL